MTPEQFYTDVYDRLLEGARSDYNEGNYISEIGSIGIYAEPHSGHVQDFYINEEYRGNRYGAKGMEAALDVIDAVADVDRPSVIATIGQTNDPETSYENCDELMVDDPSYQFLVSTGFTGISEITSNAVNGEYAFEARRY